jgi:hypothetical protein
VPIAATAIFLADQLLSLAMDVVLLLECGVTLSLDSLSIAG